MNRKRWQALALTGVLGLLSTSALRAQEPAKLTLKQAVTLALQNSHELALARMQLRVAENTARLDHSQFLPNLYTGSGAAYTYGFPQTPSGAAPTLFNLSYIQTVFNRPMRGHVQAEYEHAESQRAALERTRNEVILRTASDYLELAKVRSSLDWLREERESAQKVLDVTRQRVAAGLQLPIEITRGELLQARIEQRLIGLQGREDLLQEDLRTLAGLPAGQPLEVSAEELPAGAEAATSDLVQQALANNTDVKAAAHERQAHEDILNGERGGYWPSVDLVGQYSLFSRINNYDEFFRKFRRHNVNIGLQIQIPIFSARTSAAVALARSQLQQADLNLGNRRTAVAVEVRKEVQHTRELDASREVARLELKLAQESLAMLQAKFEQDRANLSDLEQARVEESEKWLRFLDANFERERAQLELLKTTGQLASVFQ